MVAFMKAISVLSIATTYVTAHPLNDQLVARGFSGVTTIETASQSYQSLSTQMQTLRVNIAARRVDASTASWQFQSFSSQASSILQAINGCGPCYDRNYVYSLTQYAQQLYAELNLLFETCYEVYGEQAISILAYLSQLDSWCQQNLYLFYQSGVYPQVILPATFLQNTNRFKWNNTYNFALRFNTRPKKLYYSHIKPFHKVSPHDLFTLFLPPPHHAEKNSKDNPFLVSNCNNIACDTQISCCFLFGIIFSLFIYIPMYVNWILKECNNEAKIKFSSRVSMGVHTDEKYPPLGTG